MADTYKAKYGISITPETRLEDTHGGPINKIVSREIGSILSSTGIATSTGFTGTGSLRGWDNGVQYFKEATNDTLSAISNFAAATLVYIKNSGYHYNDTDSLGPILGSKECIAVTADNDFLISFLAPGEAIVLKALAGTKTLDTREIKVQSFTAAGGATAIHIAVEFFIVS